jgi:hypothetical protein
VESVDWQSAPTTSWVAAIPQATANGQQVTADVNSTGLAQINKTGTTQYKLRFSTENDNDSVADYVSFATGNNGTTSYRPVLEVEYSN